MEFLTWFYSKGIEYYLFSWKRSVNWVIHYFSLGLLLKTLFSPWKRLVEIDNSPGFNLQKWFERFTFNLVSVGVGAAVRFILFFVGLVFLAVIFLGGSLGLLFWLAMPFFGLPVYEKFKKQPKNFVEDLFFKLKTRKGNPLSVLLSNDAGSFTARHIGMQEVDLISGADTSNVDWDNLKGDKYEDIVNFLLNQNVWSKQYLNKYGTNYDDMRLASKWWDKKQTEKTKLGNDDYGRPGIGIELTFGYTPTLDKYSVDLSAPQSFASHLIGRSKIVSRMERVLTAGSSVLLVGPPGVGKKTVVLEFAQKAITGQLGKNMLFKRVLELDHNSLLSDVKDLNQKKVVLSSILNEASRAGNIILMIRDIHRLTNPAVEGYDFTDIFENRMEKRDLKIVAVSVDSEYERYVAPNMRLRKYLEKVEITPPSIEEAMQILLLAADRWETLSGYIITIPSLRNILEESDRYITDVPFPEKAIEFLDAVITYKSQKGGKVITTEDTNAVLSEKTGISLTKLTEDDLAKLGNIENLMHERLIGQNTAVNLIGKTLRAKTVGVIKEKRPLGSFLFLGPTGVGKTETAKVLAKVYYGSEDNILRFDMAEYSGSEGLERLIGSVSKNQPGVLTTAIKNRPASLLLLDEIEKASKDIANLFLTLLDEGVITDAFGKKVICRNLFVVGTSNAGAEFVRSLVENGKKGEELQKSVVNKILEEEIFSPEFINRFDGVVVYEPLSEEDLERIAAIMLNDLAINLQNKNIFLEPTAGVADKLARDGYEPTFGARPMRRIVNISIGDIISKAILERRIGEGDHIQLIPSEGKGEFTVKKID